MVKTIKFDLDAALKQAGGQCKKGEEIPRAMMGENLTPQWEALEALSETFEALQFSIEAICDIEKKDPRELIEEKIADCQRIITDAQKAIKLGQEMLTIIAAMPRSAMGPTTAKTIDQQATTIQEDIDQLQAVLAFQTDSLEGFLVTMREVKGAQGAIEAVLAQTPVDDGEVN